MLAAARTAFAERGYDAATIRGIATAAGVDPALVHHYFGNKDKLFLAAVEAPADPDELLPVVLASPQEELGAAVVGLVLRLWDGPARPAGLALLRSAVSNEWTAKLLRALPAPGWCLAEARAGEVADGWLDEDYRIWDSTGRLVAQSRQLARAPR